MSYHPSYYRMTQQQKEAQKHNSPESIEWRRKMNESIRKSEREERIKEEEARARTAQRPKHWGWESEEKQEEKQEELETGVVGCPAKSEHVVSKSDCTIPIYRKQSLLFHPDRNSACTDYAKQKFQQLAENCEEIKGGRKKRRSRKKRQSRKKRRSYSKKR